MGPCDYRTGRVIIYLLTQTIRDTGIYHYSTKNQWTRTLSVQKSSAAKYDHVYFIIDRIFYTILPDRYVLTYMSKIDGR